MRRCLSSDRVTVITVVAHIFNFHPTSVGRFIIPYAGNFCQGGVNKLDERWEYYISLLIYIFCISDKQSSKLLFQILLASAILLFLIFV